MAHDMSNVTARCAWALALVVGLGFLVVPQEAEAACMTKLHEPKNAGAVQLTVLVPTREIPEFSSAGYAITTCSPDPKFQPGIVSHYCSPSVDNRAPNPAIVRVYRFTRERLCASARAGYSEARTP
jgi:hypothetical protein